MKLAAKACGRSRPERPRSQRLMQNGFCALAERISPPPKAKISLASSIVLLQV